MDSLFEDKLKLFKFDLIKALSLTKDLRSSNNLGSKLCAIIQEIKENKDLNVN